ncbi:hypothetical protein CB1_000802005 [Camelus ferus]|nr:hypothetical protein CB1_000802005 [Camelus ferus]
MRVTRPPWGSPAGNGADIRVDGWSHGWKRIKCPAGQECGPVWQEAGSEAFSASPKAALRTLSAGAPPPAPGSGAWALREVRALCYRTAGVARRRCPGPAREFNKHQQESVAQERAERPRRRRGSRAVPVSEPISGRRITITAPAISGNAIL